MSWEDTIKKNVFDKDPNDMTDFMNVSPRMKREAEKRKESSRGLDSIESIIEYLQDASEQENYSAELLRTVAKKAAKGLRDLR